MEKVQLPLTRGFVHGHQKNQVFNAAMSQLHIIGVNYSKAKQWSWTAVVGNGRQNTAGAGLISISLLLV